MTGVILCIVLAVVILMFGIFTVAMFCAQLQAIVTDTTQIEQWQTERDKWRQRFNRAQQPQQQQVMVPVAHPPHQQQTTGGAAGSVLMNVDDVRPARGLEQTVSAMGMYAATATLASYPPSTVDGGESGSSASPTPGETALDIGDDGSHERSSLLQLPLPPPLPPVTGASNLKLVCLGSSAVSLLSSPASFVLLLLRLLLPTRIQWAEYERMCGYSSKHGAFIIEQPRYDFVSQQYLPSSNPPYHLQPHPPQQQQQQQHAAASSSSPHLPSSSANSGSSVYSPWHPGMLPSGEGRAAAGLPAAATIYSSAGSGNGATAGRGREAAATAVYA